MKQLLYTSCQAGKSVNGSTGFQVRAISSGAAPEQCRQLAGVCGYLLPDGMRPTTDTVQTAPIRLTLIDLPGVGRVLGHSVYLGLEPSGNRFGNFFSHLLFQLPDTLDFSRAILSWDSPFWNRADDDRSTHLPDVSLDELTNGSLNRKALISLLSSDQGRKLFLFLVKSVLRTTKGSRIFLVAKAPDVAICLYGLSQALPAGLLNDLTFSTYEKSPLTCSARIVGTYWDPTLTQELPSSCYMGSGRAFNSISGRCSDDKPTDEDAYVSFVLTHLAVPESSRLDKFVATCNKRAVNSVELILVFHKIAFDRRHATPTDFQNAVSHAPLADWVVHIDERSTQSRTQSSGRTGVLLEQVVELLAADESFFRSSWPLIFAALTRAHADEQQFQKAVALLNAESAESLSAWYRVSSFVDNPDLTAKTLRLVSASIEKIPEDVRTEYVLSVIEATSAVLFKRGDKDEVIQEFENVILAFGSHADGGHSTIYKSICDSFRDKEKKDFSRRLKLFIGIVKLGLGGGSDALNDVFGDEEMRIARRLLLDAKKQRKGNAILQAVRYEAKLSEWNSKARRLIREIIPVPRKTRWWLWISIAFLLLLVTAIGLAWWLGGIEYVIDQIRNPAKK